jgi:hypothetical protein
VEFALSLAIIGAVTGIIGIVIALFGTILSNRRTMESNKIALAAFEVDRTAKEADFIEKYHDLIYRSPHGHAIIEACKDHKPVLESNGGTVTERQLENFLNDIQHTFGLASDGLLRLDTVLNSFGWVIERIHDSPEILNYIKSVQIKYSQDYWKVIVDYKRNNGYK